MLQRDLIHDDVVLYRGGKVVIDHGNGNSFSIIRPDGGTSAWHSAGDMIFVRHDPGIGQKLKERGRREVERKSEISWIVKNWKSMRENDAITGVSIDALIRLVGVEPWDPMINRAAAYHLLKEALDTGDKGVVMAKIGELRQIHAAK